MKLTLSTTRLTLRPWEINDAPMMFSGWANSNEVTKYLTWSPHTDVRQTEFLLKLWVSQYEKPERINFAIEEKSTGTLIGGIDVVGYIDGIPVIGYVLREDRWGKGYMTEACKEVLRYLFSLGHKAVRIDADEDNIGSNRVIQKCDGVFQRKLQDEVKGQTRTINIYHVFNPDAK